MSYIEYVSSRDHGTEAMVALARANQYTQQDIAQNRAGKISNAQWLRLFSRALRPVRLTGLLLVVWLLTSLSVMIYAADLFTSFAASIGMRQPGYAVAGLTLLFSGAFFLTLLKGGRAMGRLLMDLGTGRAACVEGRVFRSQEDEHGVNTWRCKRDGQAFYIVKNEYFAVDAAAYACLPEGRLFRLYYSPRSKLVLSMEPR